MSSTVSAAVVVFRGTVPMRQEDGRHGGDQDRVGKEEGQLPVPALAAGPDHVTQQAEAEEGKEETAGQVVEVQDAIVRQALGVELVAPRPGEGRRYGPPRDEKEEEDGNHPQEEPAPIHRVGLLVR